MYGQTGSGKSHTMEGIEGGVAETLSRLLHKTPHGEAEHHPLTANDIEVIRATSELSVHLPFRPLWIRCFEVSIHCMIENLRYL